MAPPKANSGTQAEFLRTPDRTSIFFNNVQYPGLAMNYAFILPIRVTEDGVPLTPGSFVIFRSEDRYSVGSPLANYIGDENGIALLRLFTSSAPAETTLVVQSIERVDIASATYKMYVDNQCEGAIRTELAWPKPETVLPRETRIVITAYHTLPNGCEPAWPWKDPGWMAVDLPPLLWECSDPAVSIAALPDPAVGTNPVNNRNAELFIPANASIPDGVLRVTVRPQNPDSSVEPASYYWRVASTAAARQLYITPALDATTQPANCEMTVTATLVDENNRPLEGQAIRWSWQRGSPVPPEPLGDGTTDANGQARAKLRIQDGSSIGAVLVAASGDLRTPCSITFSNKVGGRPSICEILEPAPHSVLSPRQTHKIRGAYRFSATEAALGRRVSWSTDPYQAALPTPSSSAASVIFMPGLSDVPTSGFPFVDSVLQASPDADNHTFALVGVSPNPASPHGVDVMRVEGITFTSTMDSALSIVWPPTGTTPETGSSGEAKAIFVDIEGAPIPDAEVTWWWQNISPPSAAPSVEPGTRRTGPDGVSQVAIKASRPVMADLCATVVDPNTGVVYGACSQRIKFFDRSPKDVEIGSLAEENSLPPGAGS